MRPRHEFQGVLENLRRELQFLANSFGQLPTERELAKKQKTTLTRIRGALGVLEREGLILRRQGKGTFIRDQPVVAKDQQAPRLAESAGNNLCVVTYARPLDYHPGQVSSLLYRGIQAEASHLGFSLSLMVFDEDDPATLQRVQVSLSSGRVRGCLVAAIVEPEVQRAVVAAAVPCVLVDHYSNPEGQVDSVETDSEGDTREAVLVLARMGHRRIGFIDREQQQLNPHRRIGYERGLQFARLNGQAEYLAHASHRKESVEAAFKNLMGRTQPPSALIAYNSPTAETVCQLAQTRGLRIPEELSVVTFSAAEALPPSVRAMSRFETDFAQLGRLAVRRMAERLSGSGGPPKRTVLPGLFIMGETTRFGLG